METSHVLVFAGAFVGGFVSGLSGFGTGLSAMPFWLHAVNPVVAAQLAALGASISQLQTLGTIRNAVSWRHVGPMTASGLIGVPIGVWLLPSVPVDVFKLGVGTLLIVFCGFIMMVPASWHLVRRYRTPEIGIGFAGGFMGGLLGMPGPLAIMWGTIQNWSRDDKRALYQIFNLSTTSLMLCASAAAGQMTQAFFVAALIVLPGTIAGSWCGSRLYRLLDGVRYDRVVLSILFASGIVLIISR